MTKTYAQLTREIEALQAHAQKLRQSETKDVIARLNESIAQYGLSAQDLHFPGSSASSSSARSARSGASSGSAVSSDGARYSDGPGRVWGGRGPRPAWLREAIAQGRSLESFAATGKGTRGAAGAPAPAKVSLPPLYSHPKTGQTWSGRGPKPAWLKQGLKKRGAAIEDFLISAQASASASASAPASADAAQTHVSTPAAPAWRKGDGKNTGTVKTGANGQSAKKSLGEKAAGRTRNAPASATKAATATPAKKTAAGRSLRAGATSTSSTTQEGQKPTRKVEAFTPADASVAADAGGTPAPASPATPVKKPASRAGTRSGKSIPDSKSPKPPVKKAAAVRKNLPVSMAPASEAPPVSPSGPVASLHAPESNVNESRPADSDS